jgi:Uma2 family endonuclease
MAIANPAASEAAVEYPVTLALPEPVTEAMLLVIGARNPEYQFETTADGRLVVKPLTGFFASGGEVELAGQVWAWNKEHRLGHVTPPTGGITLSNSAIKGPDTTFTSKARIAALAPDREKRAFEKIAPDAVFELLSPSDKLNDTVAKCEEYVETGSAVAVLLNPRDRSVTLYRPGQEPVRVADIAAVVIGQEMPGFVLDAVAVFAAGEEQTEQT